MHACVYIKSLHPFARVHAGSSRTQTVLEIESEDGSLPLNGIKASFIAVVKSKTATPEARHVWALISGTEALFHELSRAICSRICLPRRISFQEIVVELLLPLLTQTYHTPPINTCKSCTKSPCHKSEGCFQITLMHSELFKAFPVVFFVFCFVFCFCHHIYCYIFKA